MKTTDEEFKHLQKLWYNRLEEHGFNDIEKNNADEQTALSRSSLEYIPTHLRIANQEYYALIYHAVTNERTVFRNSIDKYIMTRHAEGARIKTIVEELDKAGMSRNRYSVRIIIRRYERAWKIRSYTRKQLHLKEKK